MNCDRCGRFHDHGHGSAWMMVYSGCPPEPDRLISRCRSCVEQYGSFCPQHGIRPECSAGVVDGAELHAKGRQAWADVPDASQWVDELRGGGRDESQ